MKPFLFASLVLLLAGCAAAPVVAVNPNYDSSRVGRVALLQLHDAPDLPGSGAAATEGLEPFLLRVGYDLVERGQVERLIGEQAFSHSEYVDPATAQSLGKILGVKALILGRVTSAVQARSNIYMQNVQNVRYQPVYETVQVKDRNGNERTRQQLGRYDVVTTNDQIPQTYTTPALIAYTARLVDVSTGQVLWTGSTSAQGDSLASAATEASERLVSALKKSWPARP